MPESNKIVVEVVIPAPVELVWERTQEPEQHVAWDIRFTQIRYLDEVDERGFRLMDYRTDVALGIEVKGVGRYLHSTPLAHSSFEFDSEDWKSIIRHGRGIWLYEQRPEGTYFKTVYDYDQRYGFLGRAIDWLIFRRLLQLSTEWGFETLRLWCAGSPEAFRYGGAGGAFFPSISSGAWEPSPRPKRRGAGSARASRRSPTSRANVSHDDGALVVTTRLTKRVT